MAPTDNFANASASTRTRAAGKKRARDDSAAGTEASTPIPKPKKVKTTESESASNADVPSTPTATRTTRTTRTTPARAAKQKPNRKAPIVMPSSLPAPEEKATSAGPSDATSSTPAPAPKKRGRKTVAFESPAVTASAAAADDALTPPPATPKRRTPRKRTPTPHTCKTPKVAKPSTELNVTADEAATPVPKKTTARARKPRGKTAGASVDAPETSTPVPQKTATQKRTTKRALTADLDEPTDTPVPECVQTKSPVRESSTSATAAEAQDTSTNAPGPVAIPSGRDPVEVSDLAALLQQGPSTKRRTSRRPASKVRRRLVSKKELNAAASATTTITSVSEEQAAPSSTVYKKAGEKRMHEEAVRQVDEESTPRPTKRMKTRSSSTIDLVPQQSTRSVDTTTNSSTTTEDIQDVDTIADEESGIDVASECNSSDDDSHNHDAVYPDDCLYRNTTFNPLQARVPKKAQFNLCHFAAAPGAPADTAYGSVPFPLRRLLRCSIRAQALYANYGLTDMTGGELCLPSWITRDTVTAYSMYVGSRHNHFWAGNSWWTPQRLLDVYALALYMQDLDCCDAAASALIRLVRAADADADAEHAFELDLETFLAQLDYLAADLVDPDNVRVRDTTTLNQRAATMAAAAPVRALLLDLYSSPSHAAATLAALSGALDDDTDPFFFALRDACAKRVAAASKRHNTTLGSPMFMAQERKWCERYHLHAHFFALDDAHLLFPPSAGEDPALADRDCHALRALRLATAGGVDEQMPEMRGEAEVLEEEKRMFEEWQGCRDAGGDDDDDDGCETYEQSRTRLADRERFVVAGVGRSGGGGGVEILMAEDY